MTSPALFEIVPLTSERKVEELPAPEHGPYFVLAKDALFVMKQAHWGRTLVPTHEIPTLQKGEPLYWRDIPKMPMSILGQAWSFFRAIWETKRSEAMVDITWSEEKGYRLFVPPQTATAGGVNARRNAAHYRDQVVGTIHSHCNFNAFHSGTDNHDADEQDGLHITIGHVNTDKPSIAIMVASSKVKWNLEIEHIVDEPLTLVPHPTWWERYVSEPVHNYNVTVIGQGRRSGSTHHGQGSMAWSGQRPPATTSRSTTTQRRSFLSLNNLLAASQITDPTIIDLCENIEKDLDNAQWLLDQMGIDLDYSFEKQVHRGISTSPALSLLYGDEDEPLALTNGETNDNTEGTLPFPFSEDPVSRYYD